MEVAGNGTFAPLQGAPCSTFILIAVLCASVYPANIYMFKVKNKHTRQRCDMDSNLTLKTPERGH